MPRTSRPAPSAPLALAPTLALALALSLFLSGCSIPRLAIEDDPLTAEEHINLGASYEHNGELDLAIGEYDRARRQGLDLAYLYLGNAYVGKNDLDKAVENYQKAVKRLPDNPDALNNLAWLYLQRRERLDEAEAMAAKACALAPDNDNYADTLESVRRARQQG
jgi:tetratricopeptide (TPR) repeat protein